MHNLISNSFPVLGNKANTGPRQLLFRMGLFLAGEPAPSREIRSDSGAMTLSPQSKGTEPPD